MLSKTNSESQIFLGITAFQLWQILSCFFFLFHMHTMHICSALPATNGFPAAFIAALLQLAPAVTSFVHHNCLPTRADVFSLADALSCTARLLTDTCIIIFLASANSANFANQIANFVVCVGAPCCCTCTTIFAAADDGCGRGSGCC